MQIGIRHFSPDTLEWLRGACRDGGLARERWHDHAGRPRLASASRGASPACRGLAAELSAALCELGGLSLEPVAGRGDRRRWESMIEAHHPEGWRRAPGGQLQYWVVPGTHGVLGGIGFGAGSHDRLVASAGGRPPRLGAQGVCPVRVSGRPGARIAAMGRAWTRKPGRPLPAIFPGRAEGGMPAAVESESGHAACLAIPFRARGAALPRAGAGAGDPGCRHGRLQRPEGDPGAGPSGRRPGDEGRAGACRHGRGHPLGLFMMDGEFRRRKGKDSARRVEGLERTRELAAARPQAKVVAVVAKEESPPNKKEALDRMLLSTEGEADLQGAETLLRRHGLRWRIERFFHALKQGARIGDRRLDHADDLRKRIAFDAAAFRAWDAAWPASAPAGASHCQAL